MISDYKVRQFQNCLMVKIKSRESIVIVERYRKSTNHYFIYSYPGGTCKLDISDFNINKEKLYSLLILYRGRFSKKLKH
jgi:hypothetical protein